MEKFRAYVTYKPDRLEMFKSDTLYGLYLKVEKTLHARFFDLAEIFYFIDENEKELIGRIPSDQWTETTIQIVFKLDPTTLPVKQAKTQWKKPMVVRLPPSASSKEEALQCVICEVNEATHATIPEDESVEPTPICRVCASLVDPDVVKPMCSACGLQEAVDAHAHIPMCKDCHDVLGNIADDECDAVVIETDDNFYPLSNAYVPLPSSKGHAAVPYLAPPIPRDQQASAPPTKHSFPASTSTRKWPASTLTWTPSKNPPPHYQLPAASDTPSKNPTTPHYQLSTASEKSPAGVSYRPETTHYTPKKRVAFDSPRKETPAELPGARKLSSLRCEVCSNWMANTLYGNIVVCGACLIALKSECPEQVGTRSFYDLCQICTQCFPVYLTEAIMMCEKCARQSLSPAKPLKQEFEEFQLELLKKKVQ